MTAPYAELHAHSCFSLLDAPCQPEQLIERAAALGYQHLALTDHDALHGVVRFVRAAERAGIHPVVGAEVTMEDGSHLTLLAENDRGYATLARLLSAARLGWSTPDGPESTGTQLALEGSPGRRAVALPGSGLQSGTMDSSSSLAAEKGRLLARLPVTDEPQPGPGLPVWPASLAQSAALWSSRTTVSVAIASG